MQCVARWSQGVLHIIIDKELEKMKWTDSAGVVAACSAWLVLSMKKVCYTYVVYVPKLKKEHLLFANYCDAYTESRASADSLCFIKGMTFFFACTISAVVCWLLTAVECINTSEMCYCHQGLIVAFSQTAPLLCFHYDKPCKKHHLLWLELSYLLKEYVI